MATGLAAGMAAFSMAQVYLSLAGQRLPDWPFMLAITAALVFLSLIAGGVTQQLHAAREQAERDLHGHAAGDEALRAVAGVLKSSTRSMDTSARLGGDEFVSILSSTSVQGALVFAQRVQHLVSGLTHLPEPISITAGLAEYHADIRDERHLVEVADQALYEAKREGRHFAVQRPPDAAPDHRTARA